jgi:hypothetical protein
MNDAYYETAWGTHMQLRPFLHLPAKWKTHLRKMIGWQDNGWARARIKKRTFPSAEAPQRRG